MSSVFGPTIQGEGKSVGKEVMFVRLALCNLSCQWCDTPYTWDWKRFDKTKEVIELSVSEIVTQLRKTNVKAIVISGGEPFLQQKELIQLVKQLPDYWIEIETNGTIIPNSEFIQLINQINCSPKLANSGDGRNLRIKSVALRAIVATGKANFKFVVSSDADIDEILSLVEEFQMQEVYLMPEGVTKQELFDKTEKVRRLCEQNGFKFSQRIHITKLGGGRLV